MRYFSLILATSALLFSGCSVFIANSGTNLTKLTTREQVQDLFGEPASIGTTEGQISEIFRTRQKISEPVRSTHLGMEIAMTYGLLEFVAFPYELYLLGHRTLFGQNVRFTYDSAGKVTNAYLVDDTTSRDSVEFPASKQQ